MIGPGRQLLKQAQEALNTGRLEEAQRILSQPQLQSGAKTGDVLRKLMRAYVNRGERHLRQDDPEAAWTDLLKAEEMEFTDNAPVKLRQALTRLGLAQIRAMLETGEPSRANETIQTFRERAIRHAELDSLETVARNWVLARDLAEYGDFPKAIETLDQASHLMPARIRSFEDYKNTLTERKQSFTPLMVKLHEAAQQKRWQDVLDLSLKMLSIAPQHPEARRLRSQAWRATEATVGTPSKKKKIEPAPETITDRFIMWIDGVGGFLVCLANRVTIGQTSPEAFTDIPIFADVMKSHVSLTRDGEGYSVEASKPIQVNSQTVEKGLLNSGDRITLGTSCQLLFEQPLSISSTARLNMVSGHKFGLPVDGVILMAESLLVGPEANSHLEIPGLKTPVVFFRSRDGLGCRYQDRLLLNGEVIKECSRLEMGAVLSGENFSITPEAISPSFFRRF